MPGPAPFPTLDHADHLAEGVAWLAARDPGLARAAAIAGPLRLRSRDPGFAALLSAIISQQVSTASADAVWRKLAAADLTTPQAVASARSEALRACGLSRQKIRYATALAASGIDFDSLAALPDSAVIATLTRVPGIGVWTAEIYAMFALRRRDVLAAGDLALQESVRLIYELPARPTEPMLRARAAGWAPWRTVAGTLLWQYYGAVKDREGVR